MKDDCDVVIGNIGLLVFDVYCNLFVSTQVTLLVFEIWRKVEEILVFPVRISLPGQSNAELLNVTAVVNTVIILSVQCNPQ